MKRSERQFLTEGVVDILVLYTFLKKLTTPFEDWDAFKLGIIDADGKVLRKRATLTSLKEKAAFTLLDVLVMNIKKIIERLPNGKSRLATFIAGLFLMKEQKNYEYASDEDVTYEAFMDFYDIVLSDPELKKQVEQLMKKELGEDAPANSVAAGGIAGLTIATGGPIVRKRKKFKEYTK